MKELKMDKKSLAEMNNKELLNTYYIARSCWVWKINPSAFRRVLNAVLSRMKEPSSL